MKNLTATVIVRNPKQMKLPASLTEIGEEAFTMIPAVDYVLPDGVTTIGPRAFAGSQVKMITIPASVTTIAPDAFEGCEVIIVTSEGSQAQAFAEANGFTVALY